MKELRIGLVLFGGVSLAVYMNGVATEIWNALRASQVRANTGSPKPGGTAAVYDTLLQSLSETRGAEDLRVVVDAVAGSSAGGLNGAALAKAVVEGANAEVLNNFWITKGDIAVLAAKPEFAPGWLRFFAGVATLFSRPRKLRRRIDDLEGVSWDWAFDHVYHLLTGNNSEVTPLSGRYFTRMIARAFGDMTESRNAPLLPDRGTFDLFLTRTDLHGWPRHLPVSQVFHPTPLYERTHAHSMHFRRGPRGGPLNDDFGLTYASRSTAGFPLAFAPVGYGELAKGFSEERSDTTPPGLDEFVRRHLLEHHNAGFPGERAWMIDGGVLDNKPFSYVAGAIDKKPADHQVYRVVVYVDPDPEIKVEHPPCEIPKPTDVAKGLFRLFRHEPIYGDLQNLQERNAKIERIREVLDSTRAAARIAAEQAGRLQAPPLVWPPKRAELEDWRRVTNSDAPTNPLSGYGGYVELKTRRAAQVFSDLICHACDFHYRSRQGYVVRGLVRAWLGRERTLKAPELQEGRYEVGPAQRKLLSAFDIPFRLRRVRFLVRAVNEIYGEEGRVEPAKAREDLDQLKRSLADIAGAYESMLYDVRAVKELLADTGGPEFDEGRLDQFVVLLDSAPDELIHENRKWLEPLYERLAGRLRGLSMKQNERLSAAVADVDS